MKIEKNSILPITAALLSIAACVLGNISSAMIYSVSNIGIITLCFVGAVILCVLGALPAINSKSQVFTDVLIYGGIILISVAFTQLLLGRLNLMGYVWFSDLEKNNPVAVTGLNLTVISAVLSFVAVIVLAVAGFMERNSGIATSRIQ